MSDPIGSGDWVECVDAQPTWAGHPVPFVVGALYFVERLGRVPSCYEEEGAISLIIRGLPNPHYHEDFGWNPDRFRPTHRPGNSTLIADLKRVAKQPIREPA